MFPFRQLRTIPTWGPEVAELEGCLASWEEHPFSGFAYITFLLPLYYFWIHASQKKGLCW